MKEIRAYLIRNDSADAYVDIENLNVHLRNGWKILADCHLGGQNNMMLFLVLQRNKPEGKKND